MWKPVKLALAAVILTAAFNTPSYSEWPSCDHCVNWCQLYAQTPPQGCEGYRLANCLCDNCPECAISACPGCG